MLWHGVFCQAASYIAKTAYDGYNDDPHTQGQNPVYNLCMNCDASEFHYIEFGYILRRNLQTLHQKYERSFCAKIDFIIGENQHLTFIYPCAERNHYKAIFSSALINYWKREINKKNLNKQQGIHLISYVLRMNSM